MKRNLFVLFFSCSLLNLHAQKLDQLIKKGESVLNASSQNANNKKGSNLSNTDIINGLREALQVGARNASGKLNQANGYFGNALIKILLPPEVKQIESTLRSFGFSSLCDKLILSMNRAAEDAAGKALPIFVQSITSMTITDGLDILRGGNHAATEYLKQHTTAALTTTFRPVIQASLNKVNASTYWNEVFRTYNKLPITKHKVNTDLTGYVTERALNGLFTTVADEEEKIRLNPAAQVSSLLQKVFGSR